MSRIILLVALVASLAGTALAQAPVVFDGGVVNGASFRPAAAPGGSVSIGMIVSIFGTNLATGTVFAPGVPLPFSLGGTSMTIGGRAAALIYVSATQINAQVPWGVSTGTVPVVVTTAAGSSAPVNVVIAAVAPGIFAKAQNGRGPGAIQNYVGPGQTPDNDFARAIAVNGILIVYGTGFGDVQNRPADGAAGNGQATVNRVTATLGGLDAPVEFSGLTGGNLFVGLNQINIRVPANVPEGCFVPLQLIVAGAYSNMVTVSVAAGGNCSSASSGAIITGANASFGAASLVRQQAETPQPDYFGASFMKFAATAVPATSCMTPPSNAGCCVEVYRFDPTSPPTGGLSGFRSLNAGTLTLSGPNFAARTISPEQISGFLFYSLVLGLNVVAPGTWTLSGSGGADVGAFGPVNLNIAGLFNVTSFGFTGTTFSRSQSLNQTWTCPDPGGEVVSTVTSTDILKMLYGTAICTARCGAGSLTIPSSVLQQLPPSFAAGASVFITFIPDFTKTPQIRATGLDLGYFTYSDGASRSQLTLQ